MKETGSMTTLRIKKVPHPDVTATAEANHKRMDGENEETFIDVGNFGRATTIIDLGIFTSFPLPRCRGNYAGAAMENGVPSMSYSE